MPIVVQLRPEMFTQHVSRDCLKATAAIHELVLIGIHHVIPFDGISQPGLMLAPRSLTVLFIDADVPALERASIEELLNDGVIPVLLTKHDPPPGVLTAWIGTMCQDAAPPARPGGGATAAM